MGHSEGAIIANIVAAKEPSLRAIVLLAGVARPAHEVLVFQITNNINHNTRFTQAQKDSAIAGIPQQIEGMMARDPWMAYFLTHDPAATARQVKAPAVLILTGANDQQADPKQVPDWALPHSYQPATPTSPHTCCPASTISLSPTPMAFLATIRSCRRPSWSTGTSLDWLPIG